MKKELLVVAVGLGLVLALVQICRGAAAQAPPLAQAPEPACFCCEGEECTCGSKCECTALVCHRKGSATVARPQQAPPQAYYQPPPAVAMRQMPQAPPMMSEPAESYGPEPSYYQPTYYFQPAFQSFGGNCAGGSCGT